MSFALGFNIGHKRFYPRLHRTFVLVEKIGNSVSKYASKSKLTV